MIMVMEESSSQKLLVQSNGDVPSVATAAVLKPSEPMPDGAKKVQGIDFSHYDGRDITVQELVAGMSRMGFQATAVGEAIRITNGMVCCYRAPSVTHLFFPDQHKMLSALLA